MIFLPVWTGRRQCFTNITKGTLIFMSSSVTPLGRGKHKCVSYFICQLINTPDSIKCGDDYFKKIVKPPEHFRDSDILTCRCFVILNLTWNVHSSFVLLKGNTRYFETLSKRWIKPRTGETSLTFHSKRFVIYFLKSKGFFWPPHPARDPSVSFTLSQFLWTINSVYLSVVISHIVQQENV